MVARRSGQQLPHHWASYASISDAARTAYLQWLASDRNAISTPIGYVFLYFYGLERRLLAEVPLLPGAGAEHEKLLTEVRRLLSIYGHDNSFRGYATGLLDALTVSGEADSPQARLGRLARDRMPVPAAEALRWISSQPTFRARTPMTRCPDEFAALFAHYYRERYGEGLVLRPGVSRLTVPYKPASGGFGGHTLEVYTDLPDIAETAMPSRDLEAMAERAFRDLDQYSRYIGRNPTAVGSAPALALLPPELPGAPDAAVRELWSWADRMLGAAVEVQVDAAALLARYRDGGSASTDVERSRDLAFVLERHRIGVAPDVRFHEAPIRPDGRCALFRHARSVVAGPSAGYRQGVSLIRLAATVASGDAERDVIRRYVIDRLDLGEDERRRLNAYLLTVDTASDASTVSSAVIADLDAAQRRLVSDLLIAVAAADGTITRTELTRLVDAYIDLGLDPQDVTTRIRELAMGPTPLATPFEVTDSPASVTHPDVSVVVLDPVRLNALRDEQARSYEFLAPIFDDESDAALDEFPRRPDAATGLDTAPSGIAGLDEAHSALLRRLAQRAEWESADFERLAAEHGLLPRGALDTLNDVALDRCDEPVCEVDGQVITINTYALEEILG